MALKRDKREVKAIANAAFFGVASFTGAGAAATVVSPATSLALRDNMAATGPNGVATSITRNGVGDHTYVLPEAPTRMLFADARCFGTTALQATITTLTVNANNTLTIRVITSTPAGVATDMATTDQLRILIHGSDSGS